MTIRVVLDTNVVVSALLFRGVASRLHGHWRVGRIRLVVSTDTLAELARVLHYPKFKLAKELIEALIATEFMPFCDVVDPDPAPPVCRDSTDDKFLWCARDGAAEMLVTGDPDLLTLAPAWSGVSIVRVADLLVRLDPPPA